MKFIPILFSTPMVQAILEGRKTMTRRVVKEGSTASDWLKSGLTPNFIAHKGNSRICPYGQKGDVLWVRETHYAFGEWKKNGITKTGKQKWKFVRQISVPVRFIDNKPDAIESPKFRGLGWYKRSSLFLEKKACRTFLEITNIRVERLQDISEQDAIAEGIECVGVLDTIPAIKYYRDYMLPIDAPMVAESPEHSFKTLWWSINGEDSWEANPYVWVIEFKRIDKPVNFN